MVEATPSTLQVKLNGSRTHVMTNPSMWEGNKLSTSLMAILPLSNVGQVSCICAYQASLQMLTLTHIPMCYLLVPMNGTPLFWTTPTLPPLVTPPGLQTLPYAVPMTTG